MGYSDFKTLNQAIKAFDLTLENQAGLLAPPSPVQPSALLTETLERQIGLAIAIDTEKARSELIVSPILLEVYQRALSPVSYFSGVTLTVDASEGLNGECDFILSASSNQLDVSAPIVTLVEAKDNDISSGLGQCVAQMVGAQRLNWSEGLRSDILGAVTTGGLWRLLKLSDLSLQIDLTEYVVPFQLAIVLGFLSQPFSQFPP